MPKLSCNLSPIVPYRFLEASGLIQKGACVLHHIVITPNGVNDSYVDIHDGLSTTDPMAMRIRTQKLVTRTHTFGSPIYLQRGCYAEFGTNLQMVTISVESIETYFARVLGWEKMRRLT